MGLVRTLTVTCDGTTPSGIGPCLASHTREDVGVADVRRAAKRGGWSRVKVYTRSGMRVIDLCPACRGGRRG